jgi:hypothetical protein
MIATTADGVWRSTMPECAAALKAMETGTSELRPQLAATTPGGNSPTSGEASDTASCGGKVTRSQTASARSFPIDRKLKQLPHEQRGKTLAHRQRALRNSPTQQGRPREPVVEDTSGL